MRQRDTEIETEKDETKRENERDSKHFILCELLNMEHLAGMKNVWNSQGHSDSGKSYG